MLQPTIGMKKLDVLDTNLNGRSKWKSVKMSCRQITQHEGDLSHVAKCAFSCGIHYTDVAVHTLRMHYASTCLYQLIV